MRNRRFFAVLAAPILAMACADGSTEVAGGDGGMGGNPSDASYGADDAGSGSDAGATPIDSGGTKIDSGTGGPAAPLVTDGGDCIGDPQAPVGYDFACSLALDFDNPSPCAAGMNQCGASQCCFTDPASKCYTDYPEAGTQCVPLGM